MALSADTLQHYARPLREMGSWVVYFPRNKNQLGYGTLRVE
jgi:hypothetical protein